jgi:hypothetical protein
LARNGAGAYNKWAPERIKMAFSPWAYRVTDAQWQRDIDDSTAVLAQLDALKADGLAPFIADYAKRWDAGFEPWMLLGVSAEACAALGLEGEALREVADYLEYDTDRYPWLAPADTTGDAKGWYARGKAAVGRIEARYGARVYPEKEWPKMRADAKRRIRKATLRLAGK